LERRLHADEEGAQLLRVPHGLGYTKITGAARAARGVLCFVPLGETAEVHQVTLRTKSSAQKSFKLFSFIEFCLWNAHDDATNFQRKLQHR